MTIGQDCPDGSVYEYLNFGRYQTPLQQIAVIILEGDDEIILDWTPAVTDWSVSGPVATC